MPLNKITGEQIQGRDAIFRAVPVEKWRELEKITTSIKQMVGKEGKFQREVDVQVSLYEAALGAAQIAYYKMGCDPRHLKADCIVQEYVVSHEVAFIWCAQINGQDVLVPCVFQLTPQQISDLKVRNLWMDYRVN